MLTVLTGDAIEQLRKLEAESVQCCVTSPPYWGLRDYSANGQLGLEKTPEEYVAKMVAVFRKVRRLLRKDGTILDPFGGSGTTGMVALELGRKAVLIELNPKYCELIRQRCNVTLGLQLS